MNARLLAELEETVRKEPHLSFSRLNRYLHCPEQYRLHYIENLRPRYASAALVFGQVLHEVLAGFFRGQPDPAARFLPIWAEAKDYDLAYSERDSWDKLNGCGSALLEKFVREDARRVSSVQATEKTFEFAITGLDVPFVGIIDLLADLDGRPSVIDFKTSASAYQDHEVMLSDQLTAYRLAEPGARQAALCVFVKTKEPRIESHVARRSGAQLLEFLAKAGHLAREIDAGHFFKRPGKWCSWCDYLPVCTGDERKTRDLLVQLA